MIEVTIWWSVLAGDSCSTYTVDVEPEGYFDGAPILQAIDRAVEALFEERGSMPAINTIKTRRVPAQSQVLKPLLVKAISK